MFQGWRIRLREAEDALERGQLVEAAHLLQSGDLRQFLPGKKLADRLARRFTDRSRQNMLHGDASAAWHDLDSAHRLLGETDEVVSARRDLIVISLREAEDCLAKGDTAAALSKLESLERRGVCDEGLRETRDVALRIDSAHHLAQHGKFAEALEQLEQASRIRPGLAYLDERKGDFARRQEESRGLIEQLHRAVGSEDWTRSLAIADQVLEIAPDNRLARDTRRKAWAKVGAKLNDSRRIAETRVLAKANAGGSRAIQTATGTSAMDDPALGSRFVLWVDAVGGYLVCLSSEVIIGQAAPNNRIHVPLQADISRQHLRICRRGEGYVIEPLGLVKLGGRVVSDNTVLADGDELELADCVRIRFRQPHALSASARLEFLSRHRPNPSSDGVILMAESCVMGPNLQNHVVCREWDNDVVLYRRNDALFCRAMDSIEIDGELCDGRGEVRLDSRITGSDFSLSLEELS